MDPYGIALAPDGMLYIVDGYYARVRKVSTNLPALAAEMAVPSNDGAEVYFVNEQGRHLRTVDGLTGGVLYEFAYDAGRLVAVTDSDGDVTTLERDSAGAIQAVVAPGGQRTELSLDEDGYLSTITDPAGRVSTFAYDNGLLTEMEDAAGGAYMFEYDELGRLIRDEDPSGSVLTLTRTSQDTGYSVAVRDGEGKTTTYTVEALSSGEERRTMTSPAGGATVLLVGTDGSRTVTYPDTSVATTTFGPDPRWGMLVPVPSMITFVSPSALRATVTVVRTAEPSTITDPFTIDSLTDRITVNGVVFERSYTSSDRRITLTSADARVAFAELDAYGRITEWRPDAALASFDLAYDERGRLESVNRADLSMMGAYDDEDHLLSLTNGRSETEAYAHDAADRLVERVSPEGRGFTFAYSDLNDLTEVVLPSGAASSLGRTEVGRLASFTAQGTDPELFTWRSDGSLASVSRAGGDAITWTQDAAGRPSAIASPEATVTLAYADPSDRLETLTRTPELGAAQTVTFEYDGLLLTEAAWSGDITGTFSYDYNASFLLSGIAVQIGTFSESLAITRDADGMETQIGQFTLDRDGPAGRVTQITASTFEQTTEYDSLGRWRQRSFDINGTVLASAFAYDQAGRLRERNDTDAGVTSARQIAYDADGQLLTVTVDGVAAETYSYDDDGSRLTATEGNTTRTSTYDNAGRLDALGGTDYTFDENGFLTSRGTDTFEYGARGQLTRAVVGSTIITYGYDGFGRRVRKTVNAKAVQYFYGNPTNMFQVTHVRDQRSVPAVMTSLYYDPYGYLIALKRSSTWTYVATDQVGSPLLLADASGAVIERRTRDSYGRLTATAGFDLPIDFAGGLYDADTGLINFGFRDYDPSAGRFTARDPALLEGGQTNLYQYVLNDPINWRDPSGLVYGQIGAWDGLGAELKLAIGSEGVSACGSFGVGFGAGWSAGVGGYDKTGFSVFAEGSAKWGPAAVSVGVSMDNCLKTSESLGATVGPFGYSNNGFSVGKPDFGFGAAVKAGTTACIGIPF